MAFLTPVRQPALFKALNDSLSVIGVRVTTSGSDNWSVSDGRTLARFQDRLVRCPGVAASKLGSKRAVLIMLCSLQPTEASKRRCCAHTGPRRGSAARL